MYTIPTCYADAHTLTTRQRSHHQMNEKRGNSQSNSNITYITVINDTSIHIYRIILESANQNHNHLRWWIDPESASVSPVISKLL